jgi:hypothetical protein
LTVNGIFTDENGARQNKVELAKGFPPTYNNQSLKIDYVYNPTHVAGLGDLIDYVRQGFFDQKSDYDLTEMLNDASQKVSTQKVLLVAHSQGNFYANNFYDKVASQEGGVPSESIGVYSVATPAGRVAGDGKYLTSDTDNIIASLVGGTLKRSIMSPNTHIVFQNEDDKDGHDFSKIYLKYQGDKIISDIKSSLDKLKENSKQNSQDPCISPPKLTALHKIEGVALAVADPTASFTKTVAVGTVVGSYQIATAIGNGVLGVVTSSYNIASAIGNGVLGGANAIASSVSSFAQHLVGGNSLRGLAVNNGASVVEALDQATNTSQNSTSEPAKENPSSRNVVTKTTTNTTSSGISSSEESEQNNPLPNSEPSMSTTKIKPIVVLTESELHPNLLSGTGGGGSSSASQPLPPVIPDTTSPVITLLGANSITLVAGNAYNDPGATASDNIDGDITANIITVNPVDINTVADYTITYNVSDKAENPAVQATRLVHVVRSNVLYSQPDNSTEISFGAVSSFDSFTGSSGHIQSIKFAYNDHGNSAGHFVGVSVVDRTEGINYYATVDGNACGDAYESTGQNKKIIVELDSSVKYKKYPCTGAELTLDPTHTYGVALFRNEGGSDTQRFYGASNNNDSVYLYVTNNLYPSKNKFIKSFNFPSLGAVGVINEATHNINITVPFGVDVSALTPTIKISGGATISPNSGTLLNFSGPVVYTVTAENGDTQTYTVAVSVHSSVVYSQPDNSIEITGAGNVNLQNVFTGAMGNISNLKFSYNDYGNSTGQFIGVQIIDQDAGMGYYATKSGFGACGDAYESTGANIPVVVTLDNTFKYKKFPCTGPNLVLDPTHTYGVNLFRNQGGSNSQRFYGSSNANDNAYLYVESNGIAVPDPVLSSVKQITAFSFASLTPNVSGSIDETNHVISLTVPFGTSVTALVPTIVISDKASISPSNNTAQNFSSPVTYTVTAENSSTQNYVVTVTVAPDPNAVTKLKITTLPQTVSVDTASGVATVESQNNLGALAQVASTTYVNLSSSSATGMFSSKSATECGSDWTETKITIAKGTAHKSFCYKDSTPGTPVITVSADGLISDSQTFTIN